MTLNTNDPRLTAYALGELSGADKDAVEAAVRENPDLREHVDAIRRLGKQLETELARESAPELSADQRSTVRRRMVRRRARIVPFVLQPGWGTLLAAAAVVLVLGGYALLPFHGTRDAGPELDERGGVGVSDPSDPTDRSDLSDEPAQPDGTKTDLNNKEAGSAGKPAEALNGLHVVVSEPITLGVERKEANADVASIAPVSIVRSPVIMRGIVGQRQAGIRGGMLTPYGMLVDESSSRMECLEDSAIPPSRYGPSIEDYDAIRDNPFRRVWDHPLSTFSIDVDTASYANVRRFLNSGSLPPRDAVRIEELINYFDYDYAPPTDGKPFATHLEAAVCPWNAAHRIVRIGIKGRVIENAARPPCNLVFLLDVSGSMQDANKLALVQRAMIMLVRNLNARDRVAIVVYAGASGLVLPPTSCANEQAIIEALERLRAGGSTNGGAGIQLAYATAREHLVKGGVNRVILCTDGDFNVGVTQSGDLVRIVEEQAKAGVFLSVLGFGMGNYKDSTLEQLADKGNGNYAYIDTFQEARKVLVDQISGTLVTIAKDVKIQVEFNPAQVAEYRLIGYENRMLRKEDFNDDTKDAGEIGAGHRVTALYEIVPVGAQPESVVPAVDELRYQSDSPQPDRAASPEWLTVKIRYKAPDGDVSEKLEFPFVGEVSTIEQASDNLTFACSVASFGMLLRDSEHKGGASYGAVVELAESSLGKDAFGYRRAFVDLVRTAKALSGK